MQKYNIGIIKRREFSDKKYRSIASCGCQTVKILGEHYNYPSVKCDGCGNTNFINMSNIKRVLHPHLEVLEKNHIGFKVKRVNLSIWHDDYFNIYTKENMIQVLIYDLSKKEIKFYKNGEIVELDGYTNESKIEKIRRFFLQVDCEKFIKLVKTKETESLFEFAWDELSNKNKGSYYSRSDRKIYRGLVNLFDYTYMEILTNAGITNVKRFYERVNRWSTKTINKNGTNPKEILGVPKFVIKYIRENENVGCNELEQIQKALKKVDGNRFKELLEIVKDESTLHALCRVLDNLTEIHDTYNYNNIRKLTLYIFREVRMNQGIQSPYDASILLRDYIRMSTKLGLEYEKYPRSLKKDHDVTAMNYKVQESEKKRLDFANTIKEEEYKVLEYKKKEYSIITPNEMDDLIKEGNELSHCVASYVNDIISKKCKIYFLRKSDELDSPLATIEIRGANIRQARGYANRKLKQEEADFVADWAKKSELQLNLY